MRCQFHRAGVVDFVPGEWPDMIGGNCGECNGIAVVGGELDHEAFAALNHMDDRANVTGDQPVFRQVHGQRHTIKFNYHAFEDTP
jgi:hypothetical protein